MKKGKLENNRKFWQARLLNRWLVRTLFVMGEQTMIPCKVLRMDRRSTVRQCGK